MDNLDKQIRDALSPTDRALIGEPEDGLRADQLMLATFRTRNRFLTTLAFIYTFAFLGLSIWCAVRFFNATETKHLLAWGFGFSACMLAVAMLKMWFWMEMQRIAVTREVKRVELLTAKLLERLGHNQ
jgi:hypothetical protein